MIIHTRDQSNGYIILSIKDSTSRKIADSVSVRSGERRDAQRLKFIYTLPCRQVVPRKPYIQDTIFDIHLAAWKVELWKDFVERLGQGS